MTKNIGKSIRTRLLNLAKEEKQEYMKVLLNKLTKNGPYFAILFDEAISCRDFLNSERFFVTI